MRLSVIGCGYLNAVHAVSMAELGHDVVGVDVDAHEANLLSNGRVPFFESELEGLLARNVKAGRLTFTQDSSAIKGAQAYFIGVDTPQSESGMVNMTYVNAAVAIVLPHLGHCTSGPEVVAGKSTVPVGTAARLSRLIEPTEALLPWNPRFLREGFTIQDALRPDRVAYDLPKNPDAAGRAQETMDAVYAQILAAGTPRLVIDYATTELVKISANAFLTTKISFINTMFQICDTAGANVTTLAEAIGMDNRTGRRFLRAGIGFSGGYLPRGIHAFQVRASGLDIGDALAFLAEIDRVSDAVHAGVIHTVAELLVEHTSTAAVTVLRAAFKPDSNDMRNSPALDLAVELSDMIKRVVVHDPVAGPILAQRTNHPYEVAASAQSALEGTDLVIIGAGWCEYQDLDSTQTAGLARNRYVIDGCNCLDAQVWKAAGWSYHSTGRR